MTDANTRRVRVARARIRAAATLLREARGLDSMGRHEDEMALGAALELDRVARICDGLERAMNLHVERWNRRRSLESRGVMG